MRWKDKVAKAMEFAGRSESSIEESLGKNKETSR